jgi:hypothetical protein
MRERPSEERPSDASSTAIAESRAGPNTLTLGSSVSLPRFAALLALQCGGEFDEKLDVLFFAANGSDGNVRSDGRLTESQTVDALAKHASPVFKAAARSVGDTGDVEWMKQAWRDVVRAHFARATGVSFCDASRFRALASEAMHVVSSLAEEEEADAPISGSGAETFPEYVASPRKKTRRDAKTREAALRARRRASRTCSLPSPAAHTAARATAGARACAARGAATSARGTTGATPRTKAPSVISGGAGLTPGRRASRGGRRRLRAGTAAARARAQL